MKNHIISIGEKQYNFLELENIFDGIMGLEIWHKGCKTMTEFIQTIANDIEFNAKHGYILRYVHRINDSFTANFFKLGEKFLNRK